MKRFLKNSLIIFTALIVLLALAGSVNANPNAGPFHGSYPITTDRGTEIAISVEHRNSAGQFFIIYVNGEVNREVRTQMGTFNTSLVVKEYTLAVRMHGNSIREIRITDQPDPQTPPGTITISGPAEIEINDFLDRLILADFNNDRFVNSLFVDNVIVVQALRYDQTTAPYAIVSHDFRFPPIIWGHVFYVEVALIDYPDVPPARHEFRVVPYYGWISWPSELIEMIKVADIDESTQKMIIEMIES